MRTSRSVLLLLIASTLLALSSCNMLRRGDLQKSTEDSLYFREFGFLAADNPIALSRSAMAEINGIDKTAHIQIPYFDNDTLTGPNPLNPKSTGTPLVVSFVPVGKEIEVQYLDEGTATWFDVVSGITAVPFHDPDTDAPVRFRVRRESENNPGNYDEEEFQIYLTKLIRPIILNPAVTAPASSATPAQVQLGFVDENGTPITFSAPMKSPGYNPDHDLSDIKYDSWMMDWINGPTLVAGPPNDHYLMELRPRFPGEHEMWIVADAFSDDLGYRNQAGIVNYAYDPPPVHLSHSGRDYLDSPPTILNPGTDPADPLASWGAALQSAEDNTIFTIYIEASDTFYDIADLTVADWSMIDGGKLSLAQLNIHGGFAPGFASRYEEDWESRPETRLANSAQAFSAGDTETDPNAGLTIASYPGDLILDQIEIRAWNDVDRSTALRVSGGTSPKLNDITLIASDGVGASSAIAVRNSAEISAQESRFIGKVGGSGRSTGIVSSNGTVRLENGCLVLGGNISGTVYGIWAELGGSVGVYDSIVIAGLVDSNGTQYQETTNLGLFAENTKITTGNAWFHATDAINSSSGLYLSYTSPETVYLERSTFISGSADYSIGIEFADGDNSSELYLYNSVVKTGNSSIGAGNKAVGVRLASMDAGVVSRISGNAIRIGSGNGTDPSIGIELVNAPATEVHNNLIWSESTSDMLGISSNSAALFPVRHNNIWHTGGAAPLQLNSTDGINNAAFWQNVYPSTGVVKGNISMSLSVDMSHSYAANDFDMGRIIGTVPEDIMYGGDDLTGLSGNLYPAGAPPYSPPPYDRDGNPRSAVEIGGDSTGVGYSIGPYEYGNTDYLPGIIYVSLSGDDGHPLGTRSNPFASLNQAFFAARGSTISPRGRTDSYEIRVMAGEYESMVSGSPLVLNPAYSEDLSITGGWNSAFSGRNPRSTTIFSSSNAFPVMQITGGNALEQMQFDGFTLESRAGSSEALTVDTNARPTIRNNLIQPEPTLNTDWTGISISGSAAGYYTRNEILGGDNTAVSNGMIIDNSSPDIDDNTIQMGDSPAGTNTGLQIVNSSSPVIRNNRSIDSGAPGTGMSMGILINNSSPEIYSNTVTCGNPTSNSPVNIYVSGSGSPDIHDNILNGGDAPAGMDTLVIRAEGTSTPTITGNTINGGDGRNTYAVDCNTSGVPLISGNPAIRIGNGTDNAYGIRSIGSIANIYNNTISGGSAGINDVYGLFIANAGGTQIQGNTITPGPGIDTYGIYVTNGNITISNETITTAGGTNTSTGIALLNAINSFISDSTISSGNSPVTKGISGENSASLTLTDNTISGGDGGTESYGVHLINSAGSRIQGDEITAGAGDSSYGLYVDSSGSTTVEKSANNPARISGGNANIDAYGIIVFTSTPVTVTDSIVSGGRGPTTTGIRSVATPGTYLRNRIYGGTATSDASGMSLTTPGATTVANCFIQGGVAGGSDIRGIHIETGSTTTAIYNNTIFGGNSAGVNSAAIHSFEGNPRIINNIIIAGNGLNPTDSIAYWQENAGPPGSPSMFANNLILGLNASAVPYRDNASDEMTAVDINLIDGNHSGNLVSMGESIGAYLLSFSANGGETAFLNGNWRLSGGGTEDAVSGGLDLSADGVYPFNDDFDSTTRSDPWSIGADEF